MRDHTLLLDDAFSTHGSAGCGSPDLRSLIKPRFSLYKPRNTAAINHPRQLITCRFNMFVRLPLLWAERMNKWCRGASGRMNIRLYFILHETFSDDAGSQSHPQRRVSFYYHQCEAFWNCFSCGSSCLKFSLSKIFFDKIYLNNVSSPHAARICSRGNFGRATSGLPS